MKLSTSESRLRGTRLSRTRPRRVTGPSRGDARHDAAYPREGPVANAFRSPEIYVPPTSACPRARGVMTRRSGCARRRAAALVHVTWQVCRPVACADGRPGRREGCVRPPTGERDEMADGPGASVCGACGAPESNPVLGHRARIRSRYERLLPQSNVSQRIQAYPSVSFAAVEIRCI